MSFQPGATAGGGTIAIGTIIAYQEFTSTVTVSGTSGAQTTVVTAPTFTADGFTSYWVDFFCYKVVPLAGDQVNVELWESASDLGVMALIVSTAGATIAVSNLLRRKVTPAAGNRQYIIKAWRVTSNGTIEAGAGGVVTPMPGYIAITKAA